VYKVSKWVVVRSGLAPGTISGKRLRVPAKSVTNLFTLLSVLAFVIYFNPLKEVCLNFLAE